MAAKRKAGPAGKVVMALATLGFVVLLLAYSLGALRAGAETLLLAQGVFSSLVAIYLLLKVDALEAPR